MAILNINDKGQWQVDPASKTTLLHTANSYLDKDIVIMPGGATGIEHTVTIVTDGVTSLYTLKEVTD